MAARQRLIDEAKGAAMCRVKIQAQLATGPILSARSAPSKDFCSPQPKGISLDEAWNWLLSRSTSLGFYVVV